MNMNCRDKATGGGTHWRAEVQRNNELHIGKSVRTSRLAARKASKRPGSAQGSAGADECWSGMLSLHGGIGSGTHIAMGKKVSATV